MTASAKGIVAQDLRSMQIQEFRADAVVLATGGPGIVYNRSTNSVMNTGTAASAVYQQGARYANGEFIQVHPTAIPGLDKLRLMSESARGEGGRVWVPRKARRPPARRGHPGGRALLLPGRKVPGLRQPRPPRHRHPRDLRCLRQPEDWASSARTRSIWT